MPRPHMHSNLWILRTIPTSTLARLAGTNPIFPTAIALCHLTARDVALLRLLRGHGHRRVCVLGATIFRIVKPPNFAAWDFL